MFNLFPFSHITTVEILQCQNENSNEDPWLALTPQPLFSVKKISSLARLPSVAIIFEQR